MRPVAYGGTQPPATQLDAEPWKVGGETANACAVPQRYVGACSFHVDPHQLDDNEKLSCRANAQRSLARGRLNVPVLRFEGVKIIDFHLDGNIVRITIDVAPKEQNRPQLVKVIGGDYLESAALPLKELSGADVIGFRCLQRRAAVSSASPFLVSSAHRGPTGNTSSWALPVRTSSSRATSWAVSWFWMCPTTVSLGATR